MTQMAPHVNNRDMPDEDLLTPSEVANLCRVTKTTVFRWVAEGELEAIRLGKRVVRFRRVDVDRFLGAERAS